MLVLDAMLKCTSLLGVQPALVNQRPFFFTCAHFVLDINAGLFFHPDLTSWLSPFPPSPGNHPLTLG